MGSQVSIASLVKTQPAHFRLYVYMLRPRGYKTCFVLNSSEHGIRSAKSQITKDCKFFLAELVEHENFSANKYKNANNSWHFHIY